MRALIWIICIVFAAVLMTSLQMAAGIELGPLGKTLIVSGACAAAVALCKAYKKGKNKQEEESQLDNPPDENDEP